MRQEFDLPATSALTCLPPPFVWLYCVGGVHGPGLVGMGGCLRGGWTQGSTSECTPHLAVHGESPTNAGESAAFNHQVLSVGGDGRGMILFCCFFMVLQNADMHLHAPSLHV